MEVRITPAVAADYVARSMAESYEGPSNPYEKINGPGTYTFTDAEAAELRKDALFYVTPGGPGEALSFGERQAYYALVRQIYAKQLAAVKG